MTEEDQPPFWNYTDLIVFIGLFFPSLILGLLTARAFGHIPGIGKTFVALLGQFFAYLFMFGSLLALFRIKYGRPLLASLGWKFPFQGILLSLIAGPLMAFGVGALGYLLRTPIIKLPMFDQMLTDRKTTAFFALFVVVLGPLSEELAFRGFLMPLLTRSLGVAAGIGLSGLVFGSLHAFEYQWSWRHVVLISTVGCVLGWVRHATGSTTASTFLHSTYNMTQLAAFLAQPK